MALNLVSGVPAGVLRVISDGFLAPIRSFSKGAPPPFSESTCPQVWAQKVWEWLDVYSRRMGPLEGGIESSFWGTGWGAKGDFMRYSYLYPYIFESRTHTFFESTCPELYEQQSWEWSDAYSWRNDLWKVNFKRVCEKPAGVLMVIWSGFLAPIRSFSKGAPHHFPKAHEWLDVYSRRMGPQVRWHRKFGNDRMHILRGNGPLEGGTGWGAKGDFMRYSYLYPYIFESRTHTFFESTCPELYEQQSWEWSDAYSWRNDLWKVNFKRVCEKPAGVLMVIWSGFLAPIRSFSKGAPPPFSESTCPQVWAQKVWEWSDAYSRRMGP